MSPRQSGYARSETRYRAPQLHRHRGRLLTLIAGVVLVVGSTLSLSNPTRADGATDPSQSHTDLTVAWTMLW